MASKNINKILIVDFGSQVTQLIARQVRELGVYCELINFRKFNKIKILSKNIKGIILSGGPKSTLSKSAPNIKWKLFLNKLPLLGICYGHQIVANICGGKTKYSNINSCAHLRIQNLEKTSFDKNSFYQLLSLQYLQLAKFELYEMHDEIDADLFAYKSSLALNDKVFYPEDPNQWKLSSKYVVASEEYYKKIKNLINEKIYMKFPDNFAKALAAYDCWIEQIEENWQVDHINLCFTKLKDNLDYISTSQSNILKNLSDGSKKEKKIQDRVLQENRNNDKDNSLRKDESQTSDSIYTNNATVFFEFDKFNLTSSQIIELELFVKRAIISPDMKILVEGHTDTAGSSNYNFSLSKKRANFIKEYLLKRNLKNNIQIKAYGESKLLMITEDEVKEKKNRRAELYLK